MSQNEQVLKYLKTHVGMTSWQAIEKFRITRLGARISDLRSMGYNIVSVSKTHVSKDGKKSHFTEYRLVKEAV